MKQPVIKYYEVYTVIGLCGDGRVSVVAYFLQKENAEACLQRCKEYLLHRPIVLSPYEHETDEAWEERYSQVNGKWASENPEHSDLRLENPYEEIVYLIKEVEIKFSD